MDSRIPDARIYVVEFRYIPSDRWEPYTSFSGQIHSYTKRKDANHARNMAIHNSPYHRPKNIRVRPFVERLSVKEGK